MYSCSLQYYIPVQLYSKVLSTLIEAVRLQLYSTVLSTLIEAVRLQLYSTVLSILIEAVPFTVVQYSIIYPN